MLTKRIRRAAALLTAALLAVSLAGCDVTEKDEAPSDALALPFAGVQDQTDAQKGRAYSMTVPKDDHYTFTCIRAAKKPPRVPLRWRPTSPQATP